MDILMHILYLYVMIPSHPARNSASVLNIHPLYWSCWWHILQHWYLLPFSFRSLVASLYLIIFCLNCDNCFYTFSRGQELTSRQEPDTGKDSHIHQHLQWMPSHAATLSSRLRRTRKTSWKRLPSAKWSRTSPWTQGQMMAHLVTKLLIELVSKLKLFADELLNEQ